MANRMGINDDNRVKLIINIYLPLYVNGLNGINGDAWNGNVRYVNVEYDVISCLAINAADNARN